MNIGARLIVAATLLLARFPALRRYVCLAIFGRIRLMPKVARNPVLSRRPRSGACVERETVRLVRGCSPRWSNRLSGGRIAIGVKDEA